MKLLAPLVSRDDIHDYFRALWRTDTFRISHKSGGYIHRWIELYARLPRVMCTLDDYELERAHFLAWMGTTPIRDHYTNPAIHDLYYLHEIVHHALMDYDPCETDRRWALRMWNNERDASLESEVFVYFELPDLREQSFRFPIWADRFLQQTRLQQLFATNYPRFVSEMMRMRLNVAAHPKEGDEVEQQIHKYATLNEQWVDIWLPHWREVEQTLQDFTNEAVSARQQAIQGLCAWLHDQRGGEVTPFIDQARAFASVLAS